MKKLFILILLLANFVFAHASEVTLEAKITGLYVAFFNRAADEGGLSYWTQKGEEAEQNGENVSDVLKQLAAGFAQHPSFARAYGDMDNQAFVEAVYRNTLGRDGDAEGVNYWTGLLNGGMSRSDFVSIFVEAALTFDRNDPQYANLSAEALDSAQLRRDLLANKVEVALQFTHQLNTLSNITDNDNPEEDPAYLASVKIISEVTESYDTVENAVTFLKSIEESSNPVNEINAMQTFEKSMLSGYVEDDPLSHAVTNITDLLGHHMGEAVTDENGKYILSGYFVPGQTYILESTGMLGERNITLHSIFQFTDDTVINANPVTELKYQLVESGKTIEEAEELIRDYLMLINGEKLEQNRFDSQGVLAVDMTDLAKLYEGSLPIDAIEKMKEDILRNESLEEKEYSYQTLFQNPIVLNASENSVKLGEKVQVNVNGVNVLNSRYIIMWSGIPDDRNETNTSVVFTVPEYPQDIYAKASLYKKDGNSTRFISSANVSINFYQELSEYNLTVENASEDNNFTIGESSFTIPADTVTDGKVIRVTELQTGSDSTVAQFTIDAGGAVDGNMVFNYAYDPYVVSDPRNLQISLEGDRGDVKILQVTDIDYDAHVVRFEVPLNTEIGRAVNSYSLLTIDQLDTAPGKDDIKNLLQKLRGEYKKYFYAILETYYPNTKDYIFNQITNYESDEIQLAKTYKALGLKTNGVYNYNILVSAINTLVFAEDAIVFFQNDLSTNVSWFNAKKAFDSYMNLGCYRMIYDSDRNYVDARLDYPYSSDDTKEECEKEKNIFSQKIIDFDNLISKVIGKTKLTKEQSDYYQNLDLILNLAKDIVFFKKPTNTGEYFDLLKEAGGYGIKYAWPDSMDNEAVAAIYEKVDFSAIIDESGSYKEQSLSSVKKNLTGKAIDLLVKYFEELTIQSNIVKTSPIILGLWDNYAQLYVNDNFEGSKFSKESFFESFFPYYDDDQILEWESYCRAGSAALCEQMAINSVYTYMYRNNDFFEPNHQKPSWKLGDLIDANSRLSKIFLSDAISDSQRAQIYFFFKYAFGDDHAKIQIDNYIDGMKNMAWLIISEMIFMSDSEVIKEEDLINVDDKKFKVSNIKTDYKIEVSNYEKWLKFIGLRSVSQNTTTISSLPNVQSFSDLLTMIKLKLTNSQLETFHMKKIKMETYGVGLSYSETDNVWILDRSIQEQYTYEATENINDKFTYDSESGKNILSFATLFGGEDFTLFDNKAVGFKITIVYEKSGVDKVASGDFVFTTLADSEHLVQTDFTGATLKSNIKDVLTGEALENAQVTIVPGGLTAVTDENGSYEISGLAAGQYTIVVLKDGYARKESVVELAEDEVKEDTLFLEPVETDDETWQETVMNHFISGSIDYRNDFGEKMDIPSDMWVSIVPSSNQSDTYGWDGLNCKVNSDGTFGQECYVFNETRIRELFANPDETYQVAVYKNHVDPEEHNWNCAEDLYDYVGNSLEKNSWSNITVMTADYQSRSGEICDENNGMQLETIGSDVEALISPNGGEVWIYGTTETVVWNTNMILGNSVNLYVLHDDPSDLEQYASDLNSLLSNKNWYKFADNIPNNGSYAIDPEVMNGSGNAYVVLIEGENGEWDISNNLFTLSSEAYNPHWSGRIEFVDDDNNILPIPANAKIRITPDVEQVEGSWGGIHIDINDDGTWATSSYVIDPDHYTSEHMYQFAIYDDANGNNQWDASEMVYGGFTQNNPSTARIEDFNAKTITVRGEL